MSNGIHISTLDEINFIVGVRQRLKSALEQANAMLDRIDEKVDDPTKPEGFQIGYQIHVCEWNDGSGSSTNMSGCYIGREIVEVTITVIENKIFEVDSRLEQLGIKTGE